VDPMVDRMAGRRVAACGDLQALQLAPTDRVVVVLQQQQLAGQGGSSSSSSSKRWGPAPRVAGCSCCRVGRVVLAAVRAVWCVKMGFAATGLACLMLLRLWVSLASSVSAAGMARS
jgi:hypothetical protein